VICVEFKEDGKDSLIV